MEMSAEQFPGWLKSGLIVGLLGVIACDLWLYRTQEQHMRQTAEQELQAVAELKVRQIREWRADQLGESEELASSQFFIEGVAGWLAEPQPEKAEHILNRFRGLQDHYAYSDILLIDAAGMVRLSLSGHQAPPHAAITDGLALAMRNRKAVLGDLHMDDEHEPHLAVIAPLFSRIGTTTPLIGAVVLIADARQFLYPRIQTWPLPSETAETLLVRRDGDSVLFLNELRHQTNSALQLRIPLSQTSVPAVMAVLGREGIVHGLDYRGVAVVAALKAIPDSPWFLVAKVDTTETFAVWRSRSILILTLLGMLIATVGAFVFIYWQQTGRAHYRARHEAEARHSITLKSIGDAVIATDAQGRVELLNPVAESLTGWTNEEAQSQPLEKIFRIINEDTRQPVENPVGIVLRNGLVVGLANHTLLVSKDGTERPVADSGAPIRDGQNRIIGVVLVFRDQTQERAAQAALGRNEKHFRQLYEQSPVGYQSLDAEGRLIEVNPAWLKLLGYKHTEVIGHSVGEFLAPGQAELLRERFPKFKTSGVLQGAEFNFLHKDGTVVSVCVDGRIANDTGGQFKQTHCVLHDVTASKRAEAALRESEREFRSLAESMPQIVWVRRPDGANIYFNQQWVDYTGMTLEESYGDGWNKPFHPDDQQRARDAWRNATQNNGTYALECRLRRVDGEYHWWLIRGVPIRDADGQIIKWFGTCTDIESIKQSEAKLRESTENFRRAVLNSPFPILLHAEDGQIIQASQSWCETSGYSAEELRTVADWTERAYGERTESVRADIDALFKLKQQKHEGDYTIRTKDGSLRIWEFSSAPLGRLPDGRRLVISMALDVTDRRRISEELARASRDWQSTFDATNDAIWVLDADQRVLRSNKAADRRFLCSCSQSPGQRCFEIAHGMTSPIPNCPFVRARQSGHRETMELKIDNDWFEVTVDPIFDSDHRFTGAVHIVSDITARRSAEQQLRRQAALLDAANDAIYVRTLDDVVTYWNDGAERLYGYNRSEALGKKITVIATVDAAVFEAAHAAVLKHDSWCGELKKTSRTGKTFTVFCRWTLLRDEQGQPSEILAINTDITEQKQLEANFLRAQRLDSIGGLVSGIAHDLNNILTPIVMSVPLLHDAVESQEDRSLVDTVDACAQRGANIIGQLLTFARGKPGARVPLPISHLLREMGKIIKETFPRNIKLSLRVDENLDPTVGDPTQIHQALMNLCVNARDAMPEGGTLTLSAKNRTLNQGDAARIPGAQSGAYVCLNISDSGEGISEENQERIFDPFFTTKEVGHGTGLGLATVLGIVRGHGGFIRIESQPGHGSTFELYLPTSPEAKPVVSATPEKLPPHASGELILVVDDEAGVRGILQKALVRHGYRVIIAAEGGEALKLYDQHAAEIKAVITDMMMPGTDGPTLVRALQQRGFRRPIIGMTGLGVRGAIKGMEGLDLPVLLVKPLTAPDLLNALHNAIAADPGA